MIRRFLFWLSEIDKLVAACLAEAKAIIDSAKAEVAYWRQDTPRGCDIRGELAA